jgi:ABC-type nitrate/sulfonate/bicarbonate transport system substrate-binding protein
MKKILLLLTLLAVFLSVACGPLQQPVEPDSVTLQLKWLHGAQFAGFYMAQEKGYYAEENIELTMLPGGLENNSIDEVVSGQADFGIWAGDSLLAARLEGESFKALAAVIQINPSAYFSLAETGISKPADLAGKRVAYIETDLLFPSVLQSAGLTLDDIESYPLDFDLTPLLNGEVDVWTGYLTNQVVNLEAEGHELNVILAYDYGAFIYSDVLFAKESLIEDNPDLVLRFVRASMRGWEYALEHPEEAVAATLNVDPTLDQLEREMNATIPLVDAGQKPLGIMEAVIWETTQDIMLENGVISETIDLPSLYTNQFVENAARE